LVTKIAESLSFNHMLLDKSVSEHQTNKILKIKWLWNTIMLRLKEFGGQSIENYQPYQQRSELICLCKRKTTSKAVNIASGASGIIVVNLALFC